MMQPSRTRFRPAAVLGALALSALAAPLSGRAQPAPEQTRPPEPDPKVDTDQRARELYRQGDADYAAGRYEQAADNFRHAYELSKRPALLFNLGNTYERMGQYKQAAEYLRQYLDSPAARDVVSVRERIKRLEDAARRNAAERGTPPQTPATTGEPATTAQVTPELTMPLPGDRAHAGSPRGAYLSLALGGLALGGTVTFGLLSRSAGEAARTSCADTDSGLICSQDAADALDRERRFALLADAGAAAAAVAVVVGLYLLLDRDAEPPQARSMRLRPALWPSGAGLGLCRDF